MMTVFSPRTTLVVCCLFTGQASGFAPHTARTVHHVGAAKSIVDTQTPQVLATRQRSMQRVNNPTTCHMISPRLATFGASTLLLGALSTLKIVKQGDISIVERFGKYHKSLEPGLHVTIPIVDRLAKTITQREQVFDIPPQKCITLDNAPLAADAVVYWKVFDPEKAFYSVVDLELAIQNLVLTQLRSEIGKLTLDATFSAREQINSVLLQDLDIATDPWGVKITRVEVRDIVPNHEIMAAMEMQMAAERTKRAVVIKSEGERTKAVNKAEGEAQSRIIDAKALAESVRLEAEAEASRLQLEAEGVTKSLKTLTECFGSAEEAAKFQLAREYIEAQRSLATSDNAKVILSADGGGGGVDPLVKALAVYDSSSVVSS